LIDAGGTLIGIISQADLARNDSAISDREMGQVVERIAIGGQRARDEAVVARVVDRAVQQPVQPDQPALLVELVLVLGSARDLDDHVQLVRRVGAGLEIVERVLHPA